MRRLILTGSMVFFGERDSDNALKLLHCILFIQCGCVLHKLILRRAHREADFHSDKCQLDPKSLKLCFQKQKTKKHFHIFRHETVMTTYRSSDLALACFEHLQALKRVTIPLSHTCILKEGGD